MVRGKFKINIDLDILYVLRDKINEEQHITYMKTQGKYRAWDKICAIMDRLDDTVTYLNELELNNGKYNRSAFDFYDFMNNAAVVIDCIKELAKIFEASDNKIINSTHIFNQIGTDGQGTDARYFEYLRSLCSVHPIETSRHRRYQANNFECSPYVVWNNRTIWFDDNCELHAIVYTSKDEGNKKVKIYISQIFEYVKTRVEFIKEIVEAIEQYQQGVISNFKNNPIKQELEFDNYVDYLINLEKEKEERYGNDCIYSFNDFIKLINLNLSNSQNQDKMDKYLNALKYATQFEHNSIQNMSDIGFENNGLVFLERNFQTTLFIELYSPRSKSDDQVKLNYYLEKISYLSYDSGDNNKEWAYLQLNQARGFLKKYVSFEGARGDFEHYALVKLALYLDCLENNCLINKNVPNDLKYRSRMLSDEEVTVLITGD